MSDAIDYLRNKASAAQIAEHLSRCDPYFVPPLSERVQINDYARKIASKATRFEAWSSGVLIGLVAAYCNDQKKRAAYVTSVSALREWAARGIAARLMSECIAHVKTLGMRQISLQVAGDNAPAIKLYEKSGFVLGKASPPFVVMNLNLAGRDEREQET